MTAMLSATKRGDKESVDALIKKTEFPDYAHYFVSTYSPDAFAAEDWAIVYKRWLSENEDHLRELLETLAKDEDSKILVRKASDESASVTGQSSGQQVYRVGGDVKPPRAVSAPQPNYPQKARQSHAEGVIVILLTVGSDGQPRDLEVKQGISAELDQAAMEAAEKWRFKPATLQGKPVSVRIAIQFNFQP